MEISRLKSFNKPGHIVYTVGQINVYPIGIYSVQVVTSKHYSLISVASMSQCRPSALVYAWWSDAVVARWPPMLFAGVSICLYLYVLLKALALHFVGLVNNYVRCSCGHASVYSHYPVRDHSMPSKDTDFTISHLAGGFSIIL